MKRRIVYGMLCVALVISLVGCGSKTPSEEKKETVMASETVIMTEETAEETIASTEVQTESETETEIETQMTKLDIGIWQVGDSKIKIWGYYSTFNEGYAWISCDEESGGFRNLAFLNKSGEVLYSYKNTSLKSSFSNGYAHLSSYDGSYTFVIDTEGNILSKYELDDNNVLMISKDGYTVIERYVSDFDSAGYRYDVYDPNGSLVDQFHFSDGGQTYYLKYYGEGIMRIGDGVYGKIGALTDGISLDSLYRHECFEDTSFGENDKICLGDSKGGIALLDKDLNVEIVPVDTSMSAYRLDKNRLIMYDEHDSYFGVYNLDTKETVELSSKYADKLMAPDAFLSSMHFEEGKIALSLKGMDEVFYTALFDENLNIIGDPIQKSIMINLNENRIILGEHDSTEPENRKYFIYDESLSCIADITPIIKEKAFPLPYFQLDTEGYSEGIMGICGYYSSYADYLYFDKNGEVLFDQFDFSNMQRIDPSEV